MAPPDSRSAFTHARSCWLHVLVFSLFLTACERLIGANFDEDPPTADSGTASNPATPSGEPDDLRQPGPSGACDPPRKLCGDCNDACAADEVCASGSCAAVCPAGSVKCGRSCVDTATDEENCGACGKTCPSPANGAATCSNGECGVRCQAGFHACADRCVADGPSSCGPNCTRCSAPAHARATCEAETCGFVCDAGFAPCPSGCCSCLETYYRDRDGDGYGDPATATTSCQPPPGHVALGGDCLDANPNVHPNQISFFSVSYALPSGGESFDYDCSGNEESQRPLPDACPPPPVFCTNCWAPAQCGRGLPTGALCVEGSIADAGGGDSRCGNLVLRCTNTGAWEETSRVVSCR